MSIFKFLKREKFSVDSDLSVMWVIKCLIKNDDMFLGEIFWKDKFRRYWTSHREEAIKYYKKIDAENMIKEIKRDTEYKELKKRLVVEEIRKESPTDSNKPKNYSPAVNDLFDDIEQLRGIVKRLGILFVRNRLDDFKEQGMI